MRKSIFCILHFIEITKFQKLFRKDSLPKNSPANDAAMKPVYADIDPDNIILSSCCICFF